MKQLNGLFWQQLNLDQENRKEPMKTLDITLAAAKCYFQLLLETQGRVKHQAGVL